MFGAGSSINFHSHWYSNSLSIFSAQVGWGTALFKFWFVVNWFEQITESICLTDTLFEVIWNLRNITGNWSLESIIHTRVCFSGTNLIKQFFNKTMWFSASIVYGVMYTNVLHILCKYLKCSQSKFHLWLAWKHLPVRTGERRQIYKPIISSL